jgi:serine/threonine-protein kinase
MAIDSVNALLEIIRQNQLLEPGQLNELLPEIRRFSDPRAAAQHLLKKSCLTPYQVNQIFQGQATGLALGQYRLLERLGEGGMGQVFKARHQAMGRIVALKVIRKDRLENERAVKRFRREIQMAGQLQHPNVVLAFDADHVGGTHFFAMEYVDGTDLARLVKQGGPLPVATACDYIRQAALGLQHAHERGMVHRDIKPGNLLLSKGEGSINGRPAPVNKGKRTGGGPTKPLIKILDMGLARLEDFADEATASISRDGTVMGTPDYMAPEQAKDSHNVDWRGDIYSLGCTFYYLLTGQVPFPGGSNIEKLLKHQMDTPRPIEQLRPDLPAKVRSILNGMLAKRKEDRIQTAGEVASLLAPFCDASTAIQPAAAVHGVRAAPPVDSAPIRPLSSSFSGIKNLFIDPETHRARRLGFLIVVIAILGLMGMFLVVLSLVSGLAGSFGKPAGAVAQGTGKQKIVPATTTSFKPTQPERRTNLESPARYLPEPTNNVWVFKLPELFQSPLGKQNDNLLKAKLSDFFLSLQKNSGIDLYADVERISYALFPGATTPNSFVLLQGSFDGRRFNEAIEQSRPRPKPHKLPRSPRVFYELPPLPGEMTPSYICLANASTVLLTSDDKLMANALTKSGDLNDKDAQRQLENLDDKPAVFLVIGSTFGQGKQRLGDGGIRSITCAFRPGNDLQITFLVSTRDAEVAQAFGNGAVQHFKDLLRSCDDTGNLISGVDAGSLVVSNNTVRVQGRCTAVQVAAMLKR